MSKRLEHSALDPRLRSCHRWLQLCESEKIEPIIERINSVINEGVVFSKSPLDLRSQRCYAVKSGVNGLLDVSRQTYKEATEDVHTLVEELTKEYELPLELRFEAGRGYYFRLLATELEDKPLPEVFVNVIKKKKWVEMSTLDMMKRNGKVNISAAVFPVLNMLLTSC
jgi:DNA mismatch repair protein MSH4